MKFFKLFIIVSGLMLCTKTYAQQTDPNAKPKTKSSSVKAKKSPLHSNAQLSKFSVTAGAGIANYLGDLSDGNKLFSQSGLSFSGGLVYEIYPKLNARLNMSFSKVKGSDSKGSGAHKSRNLSFESNVFDVSASLEYSFNDMNKFRFTPFVSAGIGAFFFSPYAFSPAGNKQSLRELGTEGQGFAGFPELYSKSDLIVPIGVGLKYAASKRVLVQFEFNYRITGTDYLDDVSNNRYASKTLLDARNPLSAQFAYRGTGAYPANTNRLPRGNPAKKDGYYTTQLQVGYKLNAGKNAKPGKQDVKLPVLGKGGDRDGDGIADVFDRCPDEPGLKYLQGCPDRDSDGVADIDDKCPDIAGFTRYQGCLIPDTDGDGVNDEMDKCPDVAGLARYQGCAAIDTDGDGINDDDDKCVSVKGLASNYGCPAIDQSLIDQVNVAAKNIFFKTYSAELLPKSFSNLNDVVKILNDNPTYKIQINGYTDNRGDVLMNQNLSAARAASVRDYIKSKGISESRLFSTGYGELNPVATNSTVAGQTQNRRVEMQLRNY